MAPCTWQQERGVLYILILTDFEETLSEEQSLALDNLRGSEGRAWLGPDLRQMGSGARLGPAVSAMSRARVWTNSFTVAARIQQEAIAQEGPLHSEELGHLLETVAQGEASDRAVQFARGLRDTAAEGARGIAGNFRDHRVQGARSCRRT